MKRNYEEDDDVSVNVKHRKASSKDADDIVNKLSTDSVPSTSSSSSDSKLVKHQPFYILSQDKYDGNKFPFFKQPKEVGYYSLAKDRSLHHDSRQQKFFFPPPRDAEVAFDLGQGYEKFIRRDDDVKERLDNILKWLLKNKGMFQDEGSQRINADFIAWRGHFTKFLCTPYEKRDEWAMAVTLFNGTRYISEVETESNRQRRKNMNSRELEMTYWGYKFEQYVTSVDGNTPPDTRIPVDNHEAYCSVAKSVLTKHRLLFSGEVDCCQYGCDKPAPAKYIELKTSRMWSTPNMEKNFYRYKLIKWWAQSFLIGIPQVICGFRDDEGIVTHLKSFDVMRMPKYGTRTNDRRLSWNGAVCFHFMDQLLSYMKSVAVEDDPSVVYLFERHAYQDEITVTKHKGSPHRFLPDWYTNTFSHQNPAATAGDTGSC